MDVPFGLDRRRNIERDRHSAWFRRGALVLVLAIVVLGLLDVFGQRASTDTVQSNGVTLTVNSPDRLRGGLIFTSQMAITTKQGIKDLHVVLSPGWLRGMTLNGTGPQASSESSTELGLNLDFDQVQAGDTFLLWISWQVNPTTVGARDHDVTVTDGSNLLVTMHHPAFVFP